MPQSDSRGRPNSARTASERICDEAGEPFSGRFAARARDPHTRIFPRKSDARPERKALRTHGCEKSGRGTVARRFPGPIFPARSATGPLPDAHRNRFAEGDRAFERLLQRAFARTDPQARNHAAVRKEQCRDRPPLRQIADESGDSPILILQGLRPAGTRTQSSYQACTSGPQSSSQRLISHVPKSSSARRASRTASAKPQNAARRTQRPEGLVQTASKDLPAKREATRRASVSNEAHSGTSVLP